MPASRRNDWGKTNEGGPLWVQVWQQVDVINVVAQTLPTMVHDYIQYLINVVAIQIMSTSWRDGLS